LPNEIITNHYRLLLPNYEKSDQTVFVVKPTHSLSITLYCTGMLFKMECRQNVLMVNIFTRKIVMEVTPGRNMKSDERRNSHMAFL